MKRSLSDGVGTAARAAAAFALVGERRQLDADVAGLAVAQDGDAVGDLEDLGHVVRNVDDGHPLTG